MIELSVNRKRSAERQKEKALEREKEKGKTACAGSASQRK
jgi:hypothetical protein